MKDLGRLLGHLKLMEKICGISYNPSSVLFDRVGRKLCPLLKVYTDDWAHSYLSKGVGGDELLCFTKALKARGVEYEDLRHEVKLYVWPRSGVMGRYSWNVFNDKRAQANKDGWKSSMSEFLYVSPVVLQFAEERFARGLAAEIESYRATLEVLDYFQAMKRGHVSCTATLNVKIESHFGKHVAVYGNGLAKPKWHSMLHEADQIARDGGLVLDTMANERENKVPKSFGDTIQKMADFERIILGRSIAHQIAALKEFKEYPHLIGKVEWKEELQAWVSHSLSCNGMLVGKHDIVRNRDEEYLEILICGQTTECLFVMGNELVVLDELETSARVKRLFAHCSKAT